MNIASIFMYGVFLGILVPDINGIVLTQDVCKLTIVNIYAHSNCCYYYGAY